MTAILQAVMLLVVVMIVVAVLAQRLKLAPSILLVVAGIGLALIPGLPPVEMAPEVVLLVILPPLIYSAGVSMSWREFKFTICSAGNGASPLSLARSSRRRMWSRRSRSRGG
jgi:CPA1 family monovalent cation:H+ antiporter